MNFCLTFSSTCFSSFDDAGKQIDAILDENFTGLKSLINAMSWPFFISKESYKEFCTIFNERNTFELVNFSFSLFMPIATNRLLGSLL